MSAAIAVAAFATFSLAQDGTVTTPAPGKDKAERTWKHGDHAKGEGKGFGHRGGMRGMGMMRAFHDLNLTDAQ